MDYKDFEQFFWWGIGIYLVGQWFWRRFVHIRGIMRRYFDGIYAILRVLDLPLADWERKFKKNYREGPYNNEEEWFGFQRGYTEGLLDALKFLQYQGHHPLHTNRLELTPPELIHHD